MSAISTVMKFQRLGKCSGHYLEHTGLALMERLAVTPRMGTTQCNYNNKILIQNYQ